MRSVWSFWSKPFQAHRHASWCTPLHHLLAWGLSVRTASRHYPETVLITDKPGKSLLVDRLGLEFAHVSTELECLNNVDVGWWALGKLLAYSLQDRPFVHLDSDVFLWKPLPLDVTESPVFTQNPEGLHDHRSHYRPQDVEWAFAQESLKLPIEWEWAREDLRPFPADNCGIIGGLYCDFLRHYAQTAVSLVLRPENAPAWSRLPDKQGYNIVVEQFFLRACVGFHRSHSVSPYSGVRISHLFPSQSEAHNPNVAARMGFTHLVSDAKSHPAVARRLAERVWREDPAYFRRCQKIAV
jgi:hypothetical protein